MVVAAQGRQANPPQEITFDVLSIRALKSASPQSDRGPIGNTAPSPNGFDSHLTTWQMIMLAYASGSSTDWISVEVRNLPGWISEFYDIQARVSPDVVRAWQNQSKEHELLRSAMRAALRDRFKLAIHEEPSKGESFELVVGKRGPRLKAAGPVPSPPPPSAIGLPGGGFYVPSKAGGGQVWTFYAGTMQDLVNFLRIMSGRTPVHDGTGLTGRYDFAIQQSTPDPDENHIYWYPLSHLGLQVKAVAVPRPALVIDHIEKPTPN